MGMVLKARLLKDRRRSLTWSATTATRWSGTMRPLWTWTGQPWAPACWPGCRTRAPSPTSPRPCPPPAQTKRTTPEKWPNILLIASNKPNSTRPQISFALFKFHVNNSYHWHHLSSFGCKSLAENLGQFSARAHDSISLHRAGSTVIFWFVHSVLCILFYVSSKNHG